MAARAVVGGLQGGQGERQGERQGRFREVVPSNLNLNLSAQEEKRVHVRHMKQASALLDEIKASVELTSHALSAVLASLVPLGLRDDASRLLMKMSSFALFEKLSDSLHKNDEQPHPIEVSDIEQKITHNGLIVWCDCNPAPDLAHYIPMRGVIRPDLLLLAWRRGLPCR